LAGYLLVGLAQTTKPYRLKLSRLFPANESSDVKFDDSIIASPLFHLAQSKASVVVPGSDGMVTVLDGETGMLDWQLSVPTPPGQEAQLISTPVKVGKKLVVLYQCLEHGVRNSHRMVVMDLAEQKLDDSFPVLTLSAEKPGNDGEGIVKFNPPTAFSHAAVKYVPRSGSNWGTLYTAFGNAGDTQPFHGWLFEIDMDAWQKQGAQNAIRNVLLTTPEPECPVTIESGTQEMICGGGIWAPTGPQIYPAGDSYELLVPTGNGQIDLARQDYANTLMRVKPGLAFDPGCDAGLCKNFDASQPDEACMASCKNLFIPRLPEGSPPLRPDNHE
jgi:hypothetical protein